MIVTHPNKYDSVFIYSCLAYLQNCRGFWSYSMDRGLPILSIIIIENGHSRHYLTMAANGCLMHKRRWQAGSSRVTAVAVAQHFDRCQREVCTGGAVSRLDGLSAHPVEVSSSSAGSPVLGHSRVMAWRPHCDAVLPLSYAFALSFQN